MPQRIVKMSCSSNAGMETYVMVNAITDNAVPLQLTHQSDAASNRPHSALLSDRHVAPHFVVYWIRSGLFCDHKSWSSYGWLWSLIIALSECRRWMMHSLSR